MAKKKAKNAATILNIFRIELTRKKLLFTLGMLLIFRMGAHIPIPGVDANALLAQLRNLEAGSWGLVFNMARAFTGEAISNGSIFVLGIIPYISASIIFQLLVHVMPNLKKMVEEEGAKGYRTINQYSRYLTVLICLVQGTVIGVALQKQPGMVFPHWGGGATFVFSTVLAITGASMCLVWLGEQITDRGIGNGISLIIMIGIIAGMPTALGALFGQLGEGGHEFTGAALLAAGLLVLFLLVILGVVYMSLGQRRIRIIVGKDQRMAHKVMRGRRETYLPIKVNAASIMPIIFASTMLSVPMVVQGFWDNETFKAFVAPGGYVYTTSFIVLIFFFCYFWNAIMFNPKDMAENLQKQGAYIKGVTPGQKTMSYLDRIFARITLVGAVFLSILAVMPTMLTGVFGMEQNFAFRFFGGTGLLIVVGVALEMASKIETELTERGYDNFDFR